MSKFFGLIGMVLVVLVGSASVRTNTVVAQDDTWLTARAGDYYRPAATIQYPPDWRVSSEYIARENRVMFTLSSPGGYYDAKIAIFWDGVAVGKTAAEVLDNRMFNELTREMVTPESVPLGDLDYWEAVGFVVDTPIMGIRGYVPTLGTAWLHEGYRVQLRSEYNYSTDYAPHDEANPHATALQILSTLTVDVGEFPAAPPLQFDPAAPGRNTAVAPSSALSEVESLAGGFVVNLQPEWRVYSSLDSQTGAFRAGTDGYTIEMNYLPTERLAVYDITSGTPTDLLAEIAGYIERDTPPSVLLEWWGGIYSFEQDGAIYHEIIYRFEHYEGMFQFFPYTPPGVVDEHLIAAAGVLELPTGEQFLVEILYSSQARIDPDDFWAKHAAARAILLSLRVE